MKRAYTLAALLVIGASLGAQSLAPSKLDNLLFPLERSFAQAAAGQWKSSFDLLERFAMLWHMMNPAQSESTRKVETSLNASARVLLAAQASPAGVPQAMADLAAAVGAYLASVRLDGDAASPQFFTALSSIAAESLDAAQGSQPTAAALKVQLYDALWGLSEDAVKAKNPGTYARIEAGIDTSLSALKAQPADLSAAQASLKDLLAVSQGRAGVAAAASAPAGGHGIPDLLRLLDDTNAALNAGDYRQAFEGMQAFIGLWPLAEGEVKARSAGVYGKIESEMTDAGGLLLSGPRGRARAAEILSEMRAQLSGLKEMTTYSVWDAGMILLREGMEALLVLAALLAMLRKAEGGKRKDAWVWTGAGSGVVLSGILAVVLGFVLAAAAAGNAREQLEGFVGLASVALMVSVGAWLHRRSSLQSWNSVLKKKVGGALATGRMWSIFALALLAVLREGAESVVFYIGIAPGISLASLLLGIGGALFVLVVIGYLIIRVSVRLPLHWFFLVATLLIYYLAFKISGESIHSLQVAGVLPVHSLPGLPAAGSLGMYATWETFAPQMVVLLYVLVEMSVTEMRRILGRRAQARAGTAAGAP